jgi:hypothetical protein
MLSWGKTSPVRDSATAGPARSREIYHSYAAVLYRQTLLNSDGSAPPGDAVCVAVVNERALAAMPRCRPGPGTLRLVLSGGLRYLRRKNAAGDPSA